MTEPDHTAVRVALWRALHGLADPDEGWRDRPDMHLAGTAWFRASPAMVASTGVSMYLTREANAATLRALAGSWWR
ncbi:hypothetical protein [Amycolatopsis panacis]|uniref:hypothetical protein n=1 Tax=Amycolatopsis panacis TaxID=2340917 RepID=UPI001F42740C|nr:hypothetical protein [Amycolatopsis panacis]